MPAQTKQNIVALSRGVLETPQMGWEPLELTATGTTVIGNGNPTDFHAVTINSAGANPPLIQIYQLTSRTASSSVALVNHGATGGVTLWYDMASSFGFILNWISGVGDLTVTYREI